MGQNNGKGLFKSFMGIKINADINGSLNVARKIIPSINIDVLGV